MQDLTLFQWSERIENPLISTLRGRGWTPARTLRALMATDDRTVRQLAELSKAEVISGQKGYKLLVEGTVDEINRSSNWLISQGKKMIRRGIEIQRRGHARIGAK
jgi:hypothetical protein